MSREIFINYRRDDDPGMAHALYGRLEKAFAEERLFMDVEGGIPPGHDFERVLESQVAQCHVMLALIGKNWLSATDGSGQRRLDNPEDFVRIEIESAMRLKKVVIPVLTGRAEMPRPAQLPDSMKAFCHRNAVRITHDRFRADTQGLIDAIQRELDELEATREAEKQRLRNAEESGRSAPAAGRQKSRYFSARTLSYGVGGIAIAGIVAMVGLPLIDWGAYRDRVTAMARRITGMELRIDGAINARILPVPGFTFQRVEFTGPDPQFKVPARALHLDLAWNALLRGELQAASTTIEAPEFAIHSGQSGHLDFPVPPLAFGPNLTSIENGRLSVVDAAGAAHLLIDKLQFSGGRSDPGSIKGEGAGVVEGRLFNYRILLNPDSSDTARLRLDADSVDEQRSLRLDGMLTNVRSYPQFDGKVQFARPAGRDRRDAKAWRTAGRLIANRAGARVEQIEFAYGAETPPVELTGSAVFSFGPTPRFSADLSSLLASGHIVGRVNVDRRDRVMTARVNVQFVNNEIAQLLPVAARPMSGRLTATLELAGSGTSIDAVIRGLEGKADLEFLGGTIERLEPEALNAVIRSVDQGLPIDTKVIRERTEQALALGPFRFRSAQGRVSASESRLRLESTVLRGASADLTMSGVIDLTTNFIEARLVLAGQRADALPNMRPEVVVMLKGPLEAPVRTLDVALFTNWLALRAVEQQSKRLEALEKRR